MRSFALPLMAVVIAQLLPQSAFAQNAEAPQVANAGGLAEIIVTARRKEESLQDVPVAVSVVSAKDLTDYSISSAADVLAFTPGLSITGVGDPGQGSFTIRGQGGTKQGSGPAVVAYLDEVPIAEASKSRSILGPGLYFDLENVQVLKGPQGTLFGRNSTGGAVLLTSRRPTSDFDGYVNASIGNYGDHRVAAAVNLPIVPDKFLLRIAGSFQDDNGYVKSLGQPSFPNGRGLNDVNSIAGRISLRMEPTEGVRIDTIASMFRFRTNGFGFILQDVDPTGQLGVPLSGLLAVQQQLGIRKQQPTDVNTGYQRDYFGLTNIIEIDVSDKVTFRNILSYTNLRTPPEPPADYDGTILPLIGSSTVFERSLIKQYTAEGQLQGKSFGDRLNWTAGVFYTDTPLQRPATYLQIFGAPVPAFEQYSESSTAIYAQGTLALTDSFNFTGGIRKTWDKRYANSSLGGEGGPGKWDAVTWTLGVDYKISDRTMVYFQSRRGYRSGGFNTITSDPARQEFGPEKVTDFELGLKADWGIGKVNGRTNVAVFRTNYNDVQQSVNVVVAGPGGVPIFESYLVNTGKARIWGAEADAVLSVNNILNLNGNLTWLDYKDTVVPSGVAGLVPNPTPKFTYSLGAELVPYDGDMGTVRIRADWTHTTKRNDITIDLSGRLQPGYGLLDAGIFLDNIAGKPVDLSFTARNIANKDYAVGSFNFTPLGYNVGSYGPPRTFLATISYRFGASAH